MQKGPDPTVGEHSGFTLTELLITLTLLSLLLMLGFPSLAAARQSSQSLQTTLQLKALLELARQHAVVNSTTVTVCGLTSQDTCTPVWSRGSTRAFIDRDSSRSYEPEEPLIGDALLPNQGVIRLKASGARRYIRFDRHGGVAEYGSFIYCPPNNDPRKARALIISPTGRVRTADDRNLDGIPEDASGSAISCP